MTPAYASGEGVIIQVQVYTAKIVYFNKSYNLTIQKQKVILFGDSYTKQAEHVRIN